MSIVYVGAVGIDDATVRAIRQARHDEKLSYPALAERFGISARSARNYCLGFSRRSAGGPIGDLEPQRRDVDPMFEAAQLGLSWARAKIYVRDRLPR